MSLDPAAWKQFWSDALNQVASWLPSLVAALLLLFLGWLLAMLGQAIVRGLLRRLRLDRLAERTGITSALIRMGLDGSASRLLGRLVYWLIFLLFILAAAESLGLPGVTETLSLLVAYLPNILAAVLILLMGSVLAHIVGDAVGALAIGSGVSGGLVLGQATRYTILIITVILALEQLNIQTTLLVALVIILAATIALALGLAFGLGNRALARNIMAGFHAKEMFTAGQTLTIRSHTGRLVSIGPVASVLETEAGRVSLPNKVLVNEEVLVAPEDEDAA
jgi:small-conductance mechanosensitive channel